MSADHILTDASHAIEYCYEQGWTDGLPVVPPRRELVDQYLQHADWKSDLILLSEPIRGRDVTAEKVAACAVMAGCLPAYLPVIRAALSAMNDPAYRLHGTVTSTGGAAPLVVVNGPIRNTLSMNSTTNLFGPGNRANATIGRAIRLILINGLDARPGILDRSTQGNFAKYSGCFSEHEEANPWQPFHVSRGLSASQNAVTVFAAESGHNILCHGARTPEQLLTITADVMAAMGSLSDGESLIVLAPEHIELLRATGWSRADAQNYLYQHARRRLSDLKRAGKVESDQQLQTGDEDRWVHRGESPSDIHLFVGGGEAGGHSAFFPSWSRIRGSLAVTRSID